MSEPQIPAFFIDARDPKERELARAKKAVERMHPVILAVRDLRTAIQELNGIAAAEQALLAAYETYEQQVLE